MEIGWIETTIGALFATVVLTGPAFSSLGGEICRDFSHKTSVLLGYVYPS